MVSIRLSRGRASAPSCCVVNAAQERLGLPGPKVVKNIDRYGNTTAAKIPLAMRTALEEKRLDAGDLVMMAAVGAG